MKRFNYFNLYIIKDKNGDILIDTGFIGIKKIFKWLNNFNVKLVILTHAHVDHIWNTSYSQKLYKCDVALSINDIENIDNSINQPPRTQSTGFDIRLKVLANPYFTILNVSSKSSSCFSI